MTEGQEVPAPEEPPQVPFLFGFALWVPTFAVVLWIAFRFLGPRPAHPDDER